MSRSRLTAPLRQSLTRPILQQPRNGFVVTTTRSNADVRSILPQPKKDTKKVELSPILTMNDTEEVRLPRAVQALYLQPLRREAKYNVPSCDLQLRSYSIRNLEFFCDFAMRAAYYLDLPAFGPVPLPKITERWTVPRSHFVFKKSQENFERITRRRLIQIRDGHPETVQIWLAFLQKHAYFGIGMKANVWEFTDIEVGKRMDAESASYKEIVEEQMKLLGRKQVLGTAQKVKELLHSERFRNSGIQAELLQPLETHDPKGWKYDKKGGEQPKA